MYTTHVPEITRFAHSSDEAFVRVVRFAVLSIRQPFRTVRRQMQDVDRQGLESHWLWGNKRPALVYTIEHAAELRSALATARSAYEAVEALVAVPGLGLAKSGFVAQMLGHDVGCLDSRNLQRLGLPTTAARLDKYKSEAVQLHQLARYCDLCAQLGGAARLWDDWCEDIGRTDFFGSAERVSAYHLECLK